MGKGSEKKMHCMEGRGGLEQNIIGRAIRRKNVAREKWGGGGGGGGCVSRQSVSSDEELGACVVVGNPGFEADIAVAVERAGVCR